MFVIIIIVLCSVQELLSNGGRTRSTDENDSENEEFRKHSRHIDIPTGTPRDDNASYHSHDSMESLHSLTAHSPPYWQSPMGKQNMKNLPQMAPPLDFRTLDHYDSMKNIQVPAAAESVGLESKGSASGRSGYAAGSAVNVARQNK